MCLQRHLYGKCGCFDIKTKVPFHSEDRWYCGYTEYANTIAFPERYNKSHCFKRENMVSLPECKETFDKLFTDLLCVKRVKKEFLKPSRDSDTQTCNCPEACDSFKFSASYSLAGWPATGPELDQAYRKIVMGKMVPYFNETNDTTICGGEACFSSHGSLRQNPLVAGTLIKYLTDPTKKGEILSNFVRLSIYIEDLVVETTEDVVGYSEVDLLSDIGEYICYLLKLGESRRNNLPIGMELTF